ncbi:MAG: UvrD-helicase domain-containing protein, partial [Myxococcales bacterium]|nr:UvrD-helicase domain-containing protein [Myxococcales bacterium]
MADAPAHLTLLNPEQYRAVTTLDGPLLILAGAGSGKTRVLTRRIAHALHTGADPKQIFACTFTNKAAAEMKERVVELVGEIGTKVWVSTFHSSCCRILRQDIEPLGFTKRFAIYDDDDQLRIVKGILNDLGLDPKVVEPRAILKQIDHYKNLLRDPDALVSEKR